MNAVQLGNFLFVNRKFHESNLFHTLDLFPLVSSEKMEIGTIITGSPPHPMDLPSWEEVKKM